MRRFLVLLVALAFGLTTYGTVPARATPCGPGCVQYVAGKYVMGQSAPSDRLTFQSDVRDYTTKIEIRYSDPTYGSQSATVVGYGNGVVLCADEAYQATNLVTITYGVGTANPRTETVEYYSSSGGGNDDATTKQQLLVNAMAQFNKAMAQFNKAKRAVVKAQKALSKAKKGKKHRAVKKVRKAKVALRKAKAQLNGAKVMVRHAKSDVVAYRAQLRDARQATSYCAARRLQ